MKCLVNLAKTKKLNKEALNVLKEKEQEIPAMICNKIPNISRFVVDSGTKNQLEAKMELKQLQNEDGSEK